MKVWCFITIFSVVFGLSCTTISNVEKIKRKVNYTERGIMDRLNAKQKIAMNQIIAFYVMDDSRENDKCKNHSLRYKYGIRNFETWALKMADASSKMQPGILNGNIMDYGDFIQCVGVYEDNDGDPIQGKMCSLNMKLGKNLLFHILRFRNISEMRLAELDVFLGSIKLYWDVCVPESCSYKRVLDHFEKRMTPLIEGLDITFDMKEYDCTKKPDTKLKTSEWIVIAILLFLTAVVIICTIIDSNMKNEDGKERFVSLFSVYRNMNFLFGKGPLIDEMQCLHGIRACSIAYVILGHRFFLTMFFPSVNMLEITDWLLTYPSTFIVGGTVSVDSFFLISGLILTYQLCGLYETGKKVRPATYFLYRYIRLTAPLILVVLVYIFLFEHLGSGPIWNKAYFSLSLPCKYFWWSTLLHVQNFVNPRHICILQTWYLSCEFQFYLMAPLLIYPLWKWKTAGKVLMAVTFVASLAPPFALAYTFKVKPNALMSHTFATTEYFRYMYITPYSRISTYIIGIGLGFLLYKTKDRKVKMSLPVLILGWCISSVTLLIVILIYHNFQQDDFVYDNLKISSFVAFSRSGWTFALAWIVWVCCKGYGGIINSILSAHFFRVIGRLTYGMFLVHIGFQFLSNGALKQPLYFSNFQLIMKFFGDFCISVIMSIYLNLTVELPVTRAIKMGTKKH